MGGSEGAGERGRGRAEDVRGEDEVETTNGRLSLDFSLNVTEQGETHMDLRSMTLPEILVYLERCIPWDPDDVAVTPEQQ